MDLGYNEHKIEKFSHYQCPKKETYMFAPIERFLSSIVEKYGRHPIVLTDDGGRTWYPLQAYKFLNLNHHIHSPLEKSLIERSIQYIKDRAKHFDDYFPCKKERYNFYHVKH